MENVRNHRDIKLVTIEENRSMLVSEPNIIQQTFSKKFVGNRNEKDKSNKE